MKSVIVALALVAIASALPVEKEPEKILRSEFNQDPSGGYSIAFETENGISHQETGKVEEILDEENKPHKVVTVKGSYSYINDQGKSDSYIYWADQNGFHVEGDSVPKPVQAVSRR